MSKHMSNNAGNRNVKAYVHVCRTFKDAGCTRNETSITVGATLRGSTCHMINCNSHALSFRFSTALESKAQAIKNDLKQQQDDAVVFTQDIVAGAGGKIRFKRHVAKEEASYIVDEGRNVPAVSC